MTTAAPIMYKGFMELTDILRPIEGELSLVERELEAQIARIREHAFRTEVVEPVDYFFGVPGKRLRPALTLLAARAVALGEPPLEALVRTSAAAELMHSASLIHDDVIDSEQIRRGQAALNVAYGNTVAVLVGDLYCTQFFWILSELEGLEPERKKRVTDLFLSATQRMCAAEIFEARLQRAGRQPSLHEYLEIIERKTADLMSACCEAAGLICGADEQAVGALGRFGMAIGMAYQLVDDALDRDASYADYRDILAHASTHGEEAMGCLDSLSPSAARDRLEAMVGYVLGKVRVLEARRA